METTAQIKISDESEDIANSNQKAAKIFLIPIILLMLFTCGFFSGSWITQVRLSNPSRNNSSQINFDNSQSSATNVDYALLNEAMDKINSIYIKKDLDEDKLVHGSVRGLVESLDDKYTIFLDEEETRESQNQNAGAFEGIGTTLRYNGDYTIIESPVDGFPAQKSGLMPGDFILEVDGEDMHKKKAFYVASKILGKAGTEVKLKIFRESEGQTYEKSITREVIDMHNIEYKDLGDGVAQIKIYKFTEKTLEEFKTEWDKVANEVSAAKPKKIVLDLRNNPGGFVDAATYVLEEFLGNDKKILSEVDRDGAKEVKYTRRNGKFIDIPMTVIVNGGSASASEIVAGALQDYKRAKIIGENTVGKGVEQRIVPLSDGSTMHIVFRKWLTPNDNNLSPESPIKPDIEIKLKTEDFEQGKDPQLEEAIK